MPRGRPKKVVSEDNQEPEIEFKDINEVDSCRTCQAFKPRNSGSGHCLMNPPSVEGFPLVSENMYCMQHKAQL